jgi:hypothetical protein
VKQVPWDRFEDVLRQMKLEEEEWAPEQLAPLAAEDPSGPAQRRLPARQPVSVP